MTDRIKQFKTLHHDGSQKGFERKFKRHYDKGWRYKHTLEDYDGSPLVVMERLKPLTFWQRLLLLLKSSTKNKRNN